MNIPQIYLVEPYNAYAPKQKKKHWMQEVEEQALMARIIAEQQAIMEAKSNTTPPDAPEDSCQTVGGASSGTAAAGGGQPPYEFFHADLDVVDFDRSPATGSAPLTVTFTNRTTTPHFDSYNWYFTFDGVTTTTTDVSPVVLFNTGSTNPMTITASLQVTNSVTGETGSVKTGYTVVNYPTVTAAFTYVTTSNVAPFSVSFVNTSTNDSQTPSPLTYLWTFVYNNGTAATTTSSSLTSPSSRRVDSGSFTASLQATGSYGIATTASVMIAAPAPTLTAAFTFTTSSNFAPSNATFLSNNTYNGAGTLTYFWNLGSGSNFPSGDNSASIIPNPPNTYTASGSYTASYQVTESLYGITSLYTQSFKLLQPQLFMSFSVNTGSGIAPQSVPFAVSISYDGPGGFEGLFRFGELRENLTEYTTPYVSPTYTSFTYETRSLTGQDGKFTASLAITASTSGITAFYTQSFYIAKPTLIVAFITRSFGNGGTEDSYMEPVSMSFTSSNYWNGQSPVTVLWDFGSASFWTTALGEQTGTTASIGPHFRADYAYVGAATPYTASLQMTGSYGLSGSYTQSFLVET